jgi:photosystem II stability/assembly factor-like uncharacterized protein
MLAAPERLAERRGTVMRTVGTFGMMAGGMLVITALLGARVRAAEAAHWEQCGWGGGGFYWSCAFHPAKQSVIYLGGDVGGVYKTEDGGRQWRFANDGLTNYAVYALAVDPSSPDTVYAGTEGGICKSTDAAAHWKLLEATAPNALNITSQRDKSVRNIAVAPTDSRIVYAGTVDGRILRSADGGGAWSVVYKSDAAGSVGGLAVCASNPRLVLAASTGEGVLRSADAGATWQAAGTAKDARSVAIAPDGRVAYAACGKDGVLRSSDGGASWAATGSGIDPKCVVVEVAVDPSDPSRVCCIGTDGWNGFFYYSEDGGATWTPSRTMRRDFDADPTLPDDLGGRAGGTCALSRPANLALDPAHPERLFIAGNWRPCISQDGGRTWQESDRGADITVVTDIRFCEGRTYVTAMDEGLMVSPDGGASWRQLVPLKYDPAVSGHQWRVSVRPGRQGDHIVSTCSPWDRSINLALVSDDGGRTFQVSGKGLPERRPTADTMWGQGYARALAADPSDPDVFYMGIDGAPQEGQPSGGVFRSADGGLTWQRTAGQPGSRRMFYGLVVDPTDTKRLFWGCCGTEGGLWRSDDAGSNWTRVFSNETWLFNATVSPGGAVYAAGHDLWRSIDHGATWTRLTSFGDSRDIVGLQVKPGDENTVWLTKISWNASATGSIYKTTDGGKSWADITGDLPYRQCKVLRYDPATGYLWAGGTGLFRLKQ